MKRFIYLILFSAVLALTVGCMGGKGGGVKGSGADSINWHDSCLAGYRHIQDYYFAGQHDSMLAEAPAVMELCREHEEWTVYYNAWERLAERFVWEEEFDRAAAEAEAMRADASSRQNNYGQAIAYYVLGQGYTVQDNFAEAARCYQQTISYYPDAENPSMLNLTYYQYSQALLHIGQFDRMGQVHQQWRQLLNRHPVKADDPQRDLYANWHMQYCVSDYLLQIERNQLDAAAQALDSAAYYEVIDGNIPANINLIMRYRCQLANARGQYATALDYADSTLQMSANMSEVSVIGALEERTKALKGLGRYAEALADHEHLKQLNDSIIQADNREQLNTLSKRFELSELQLQNERTRRNFIVALAAVVLLLVIVAFGLIYTRRIRQKNRKLYEQIMQLQTVEETSHTKIPESAVNPLYVSICRLMADECLYTDADLNRSDLAQRLGTNDRYIADAITEGSDGQTFLQFVNGYRLARATQLLSDTDDSIEQIAFASGFNNRRTFNRIFREEYGMSPTAFRIAAKER